MGFLQTNTTEEEEKLSDDLYKLFKCEKEDEILAENL